jgi:hypothetical protein
MGDGSELSYPMYADFRDHKRGVRRHVLRYTDAMHVGDGGRSERVNGEMVSGTFFQVLGVTRRDRPHAGALRRSHRERIGGRRAQLRLLAHAVRRQPDVLGRKLVINGHPFTVIGVSRQGVQRARPRQPSAGVRADHDAAATGPGVVEDRHAAIPLGAGVRAAAQGITAEQAHTALQPYMRAMLELESRDAAFTTASAETRKKFIETRLVVESIARVAGRGCATRSACPSRS